MADDTMKTKSYADLPIEIYELPDLDRDAMMGFASVWLLNKTEKPQLVMMPKSPCFRKQGNLLFEVLDYIAEKNADYHAYEVFECEREYKFLDQWPVRTLVTTIQTPDSEQLCRIKALSDEITEKTVMAVLFVESEGEAERLGRRWHGVYDCWYYKWSRESLLSYARSCEFPKLVQEFIKATDEIPNIGWNPVLFKNLEIGLRGKETPEELDTYCKSVRGNKGNYSYGFNLLLLERLAEYWKNKKPEESASDDGTIRKPNSGDTSEDSHSEDELSDF